MELNNYQNGFTYFLILENHIKEKVIENPGVKDANIDLFLFDNKYYVYNDIDNVYHVRNKIKTITQCLGFKTLDVIKSFSKEYSQINSLIRTDVSDDIFICLMALISNTLCIMSIIISKNN